MQEPPDNTGKSVRFGCGALFGAVVAGIACLWRISEQWPLAAFFVVGAALVCGFLAVRYGDDFWSWMADHCWWF